MRTIVPSYPQPPSPSLPVWVPTLARLPRLRRGMDEIQIWIQSAFFISNQANNNVINLHFLASIQWNVKQNNSNVLGPKETGNPADKTLLLNLHGPEMTVETLCNTALLQGFLLSNLPLKPYTLDALIFRRSRCWIASFAYHGRRDLTQVFLPVWLSCVHCGKCPSSWNKTCWKTCVDAPDPELWEKRRFISWYRYVKTEELLHTGQRMQHDRIFMAFWIYSLSYNTFTHSLIAALSVTYTPHFSRNYNRCIKSVCPTLSSLSSAEGFTTSFKPASSSGWRATAPWKGASSAGEN